MEKWCVVGRMKSTIARTHKLLAMHLEVAHEAIARGPNSTSRTTYHHFHRS
jgi:hypothetical protein